MSGTARMDAGKTKVNYKATTGSGMALGPALVLGMLFVAAWFFRSNTSPWGAVFIGEDFPVFWWQAYVDPIGSLSKPYAGYLHLVPRLAGTISALTPKIGAPLVFLLVYVGALYVLVAGLLSATWRVGMLSLAALLIAPNTGEVFASITYFQWVSAPLLVALYFGDFPEDWPRRVLFVSALLIAGLSGPFSALLAPFAALELIWAWRVGRLYDPRGRAVVCGAVIACGALSALAYFVAGSEQLAHGENRYYATLAYDAFRQTFSVLAQGSMMPADWRALLAVLVLCACLLAPPYRWQKAVLVGFSFLVVLAAVHKFRFDAAAFAQPQFATRYFFVAIVAILVVFGLTLLSDITVRWTVAVRWAVAATVVVIALSYNYLGWRGPERVAVDWHAQRNAIETEKWASVFVNPFWNFVVARRDGAQRLYWVTRTVQPTASSAPSVVPLGPDSTIRLSGAVDAVATCGFEIPVVRNPGFEPEGGSLMIRVKARSPAGGSMAQESFKVPVLNLQDWSTVRVGAGVVGAQQVDIEIEPVADRSMHIGVPAQENSGAWSGSEMPSGRTFPSVVWPMECTTASPFGELKAKPTP